MLIYNKDNKAALKEIHTFVPCRPSENIYCEEELSSNHVGTHRDKYQVFAVTTTFNFFPLKLKWTTLNWKGNSTAFVLEPEENGCLSQKGGLKASLTTAWWREHRDVIECLGLQFPHLQYRSINVIVCCDGVTWTQLQWFAHFHMF